MEMLGSDYDGIVLSFDGAAKTSTKKGSFTLEDVTVNDGEYQGLRNGLVMASERNVEDLVVVGDSRIVIQQVQCLINCHQPNLQRRLAECQTLKEKFRTVRLVHVKREYNQSADYLTSKTLASGENWEVTDQDEFAHLERVSRIAEQIMKRMPTPDEEPKDLNEIVQTEASPEETASVESASLLPAAKVLAVLTRSAERNVNSERPPMGPLEFQTERWRRIRVHQDGDEYLSELKRFLKGDFDHFSPRHLWKIAKHAELFVLDARDILYRLAQSTKERPRDMESELRLVVPTSLREDLLHFAHEDYQGGHQGIKKTHEKLRTEFYWSGMYANVERYTVQVERDVLRILVLRPEASNQLILSKFFRWIS
ncbi:hypothetical protein PHMEG_00014898 [Phytophthora megakarya]|uniref:Uncharacterized protein n=1 Tax=Phytophthora megakarya TaxID=4795 RepID=A0A225W371_9STRA|nr:hypothetical protein PHMEG_00014898 [Phytophthora megakarya]